MPDVAILINDDAEAFRRHQWDKDEWGQRGWDRVEAICLWFALQGVEHLPCRGDATPVIDR